MVSYILVIFSSLGGYKAKQLYNDNNLGSVLLFPPPGGNNADI